MCYHILRVSNQRSLYFRAMQIPSPEKLHSEFPLSPEDRNFINSCKKTICRILNGEDPRLLLITGPCSIHDIPSALEYATKLQTLSSSISPFFFPVMRVYFEKPRTKTGWKGFLSDPWLDGTCDIASGLQLTCKLLVSLAGMGIAAAAEFLDPSSANYFGDLVSWGCIGARTVESQIHRQIASHLPMPVGFKNSTSGNIEVAINSILSASNPHIFLGINEQGVLSKIHSKGNPYGHLVLRGGNGKSNCTIQDIEYALSCMRKANLSERILIDSSHDNSGRLHENQIKTFESALEFAAEIPAIRGLLLESHIFSGNQKHEMLPSHLQYGISLTDPCLDWKSTETLLLKSCEYLKRKNSIRTNQERTLMEPSPKC